jgi:hypothetical protein
VESGPGLPLPSARLVPGPVTRQDLAQCECYLNFSAYFLLSTSSSFHNTTHPRTKTLPSRKQLSNNHRINHSQYQQTKPKQNKTPRQHGTHIAQNSRNFGLIKLTLHPQDNALEILLRDDPVFEPGFFFQIVAQHLNVHHAPMWWQRDLVLAFLEDWLENLQEQAAEQQQQLEQEEEEQQPELICAIWIGDKTFPAIVFVLGDHDSRSYRNDPCDEDLAVVSRQTPLCPISCCCLLSIGHIIHTSGQF